MTPPSSSAAPRPFPRLARRSRWSLALLLAGVAACGAEDSTYEVSDVREVTDAGPVAPPSTLDQRLGVREGMGANPHGAVAPRPGGTSWTWVTPAGWKELPPAPMREAGWQPAGNADTECTFSTAGGGFAMNVNRWRKQMSLEPLADEELEKLPKDKVLLGRAAWRVEMAGTYVGMRGDKNVADAKLLGLIVQLPSTMAFLKMVGPASVVDAETERFHALGASIRPGPGGAAPEAAPMPEGPPAVPGARTADFRWTVPEGWQERPARPPRVATFVPAGATRTECLVTVLGGTAGGAKANLDLWREQLGGSALTDAEFAALLRRPILGGKAVFLEATGVSAGKSGSDEPEPYMLLGMILERATDSIFVKMTGPTAEVAAERDRFREFCESFRE